jgi:hypothetical protein
MGEFYGRNVFLAETSSTSGGLDSLLDPHGTIQRAMDNEVGAAQHLAQIPLAPGLSRHVGLGGNYAVQQPR